MHLKAKLALASFLIPKVRLKCLIMSILYQQKQLRMFHLFYFNVLSCSSASELIRYWSISTIGLIARVCKPIIYKNLNLFLPADEKDAVSTRPFSGYSLLTSILYDNSAKVL